MCSAIRQARKYVFGIFSLALFKYVGLATQGKKWVSIWSSKSELKKCHRILLVQLGCLFFSFLQIPYSCLYNSLLNMEQEKSSSRYYSKATLKCLRFENWAYYYYCYVELQTVAHLGSNPIKLCFEMNVPL